MTAKTDNHPTAKLSNHSPSLIACASKGVWTLVISSESLSPYHLGYRFLREYSFHNCFVPQLRAQLFTYHHLQPSLPSFPYLCFNRRITGVGAHPGELIFSKHLAFFFIFVIFYKFVIFNIFHIFVIFSIFSIFDIFSIFVIFDILLLFDIYITKSKFTYIWHI